MLWIVWLAVLPVTLTTVVQAPLVLVRTWILKSLVFQALFSPPAPACLTMNFETLAAAPRSTSSHLVAPSEHHLSASPPATLPLKAWVGPSVAAHELSAVAGLFSARFGSPGVLMPA